MNMTQDNRPLVFNYTDYRAFLKDYLEHMRQTKPRFSLRSMARLGGFKSASFIKMVVDGERNLTADSLAGVLKALQLNQKEKNFFRDLVHLNQAKTLDQREKFAKSLIQQADVNGIYVVKDTQINYYSRWYYAVIRELIGSAGFQEDPGWIANQLVPRISPAEAEQALQHLMQLEMIRRNPETGRLEQIEAVISAGDDVTSVLLAGFHRQMIRLAGESISRVPKREREVSGATLYLTDEQVKALRELLRTVKHQALDMGARKSGEAGRVYQVCFQLFPLSQLAENPSVVAVA
ncbi:MAG: TIGR02147 family protein [Bacteriovoracia bacterium]